MSTPSVANEPLFGNALPTQGGRTIPSCKRCRKKKLKCDDRPKQCRNCQKASETCITIDSTTKREFDRRYVDQLLSRIMELKAVRAPSSSFDPRSSPREQRFPATRDVQPWSRAAHSTRQSMQSTVYHGTGSIVSIARLVTATVAAHTSSASFLGLGIAAAQEQYQREAREAASVPRPSQDVAHNLLESYLTGPHILHPILNRSETRQIFSDAYADAALDPGHSFKFFMVCAIGALSLNRLGQHETPAMNYYLSAMPYKTQILQSGGVQDAQYVLLILLFTLQHGIGIGNKWDLARLAIRICIENDLHRASRKSLPPIEEQMRRRIFWTAYISDRHSSSMLGRPLAIQDKDITAQLPVDADDDLIELGQLTQQFGRGPSEVTIQLRQIRLRQITSRIQAFHSELEHQSQDFLDAGIQTVLSDLAEWRNMCRTTGSLSGNSTYHSDHWIELNHSRETMSCLCAVVSLSRHGVSGAASPKDVERCLDAAVTVVRSYEALSTSDKLVMNWTCVHDLLKSGFTILHCLQILRNLESPRSFPDLAESGVICTAVQACCDILRRIATGWASVQRHSHIFSTLSVEVLKQLRSSSRQVREEDTSEALPSHADFRVSSYEPLPTLGPALEETAYTALDFDMLDWDSILASTNDDVNFDDLFLS